VRSWYFQLAAFFENGNSAWLNVGGESSSILPDTQHAPGGVGGWQRHFEEHVISIYRKVSKQAELQQDSLTEISNQ
jgi:hypothetical protein